MSLAALLVAAIASPAMGQTSVTINIGGGGSVSGTNGGASVSDRNRLVDSWFEKPGWPDRRNDDGNDDHHHDVHHHDQIIKQQGCGLPKCSRRELGLK
jgi:hypothetical protein